jgi:uncharacterized membrane protein
VTDPVVTLASAVVSGPTGRYAAPARSVRKVAAGYAALSAIPLGFAALLQSHCVQAGWETPDQFWHMCYSDLPNTYRDAALSDGLGAFLGGGATAPAPGQPALSALVMTGLASMVPDGTVLERMRGYVLLWAVLIAVLVALTSALTVVTTRFAPQRAAAVALSPIVALVALISPDPLGVALVSLALFAWSRGATYATGVFLGLAVAARTYPLLLVVALFLLCVRAGRLRLFARIALTAVLTGAGVVGGLYVVNPDAATAAYAAWASSGAGFGSPWVLPMLAGSALSATAVTALAVLGWLAAVVVGALLALGAPARPSAWEVGAVMVGIVLLTGSSFPVQSSLWLVPLAALAGLPWRDMLLWAFAEGMHFVAVWLHIASQTVGDRGLPGAWYAIFLILRLAAVAWVVRQIWAGAMRRRIQWPVVVDPEDGPLAGIPDRFVVALH